MARVRGLGVILAHDGLVIPPAIEDTADFHITGIQDHVGNHHPALETEDPEAWPQVVARRAACGKGRKRSQGKEGAIAGPATPHLAVGL